MKNAVLFGDSLTYGYGVYKKDSLSYLIEKRFPKLSVINSGVNGDTTREALLRLERDVLSFSPYLTTILFGSNDCAPGEWSHRTVEEFQSNLEMIIDRIRQKSPLCHIILIAPPPVDETVFMPWTTNKRLAPYCDVVRDLSQNKNCILADFNKYILEVSQGNMETFLQEDGCHLSEKCYIYLSEFLGNIIEDIINKE